MKNVDDDRPGSRPPDDDRLRTLRRACAAAHQADCEVCPAAAAEECVCVYTTTPVSVPVTAGMPVRPVGYGW